MEDRFCLVCLCSLIDSLQSAVFRTVLNSKCLIDLYFDQLVCHVCWGAPEGGSKLLRPILDSTSDSGCLGSPWVPSHSTSHRVGSGGKYLMFLPRVGL
jgi:hypothetical protein